MLMAKQLRTPPHNRIRVFAMTYNRSIDSQCSNPLPRTVDAVSEQLPASIRSVPAMPEYLLIHRSATL